ncbi:MAG: DUF3277 family protein [Provencibacterium sp.]|jgi:hypothetical protein|nr:DUF3277 family protein [Provencibacterium sp.]
MPIGYEATYDPEKVTVTIDGRVMTGFAADGKITIVRNEDSVTAQVSVDGGVTYDENANQSGLMTVSFMSTSSSLSFLRQLEAKRKRFSVLISDVNDNDPVKVSADDCRIQKLPDLGRGKNSSTVTVSIILPRYIPR